MASRCVHELFEERVRRAPDAVALVSGDRRIDYRDLNRAANQVARWLRQHGVRRGDRVGLRLARSIECVTAMLGVLKAGAAYVPLEDGFPPAQLARIRAECGIAVTLDGSTMDSVGAAHLDGHDLGLDVSPEDTFYIPFTSGSTGVPKGTDVPHRAVAGFFHGDDYAGWGPGRRSLMHSALSWDGHLIDVIPPLLTGGTVVIAPPSVRDPVELARLARRDDVTTLWLSAQAFNTVIDVDPSLLAGLTWLMTGGEALSVAHVDRALAALPGLRLVNGYGPSECTVFTCVHSVTTADTAGGAAVPIGRSVGDRVVHVLDDDLRPAAEGDVAELYVGGPAVAHGYVGRPAMTAERFLPDPFSGVPGARMYRTGDLVRQRPDGLLDFHGRRDGQVKLRGFRVELSEVEAVLRAHPDVADAAATVDGSGAAPRLVAYVVPAVPDTLDTHARERLHAAMVPSVYLPLDRLPIGRTGKLDRAALPAVPRAGGGTAGAAPRTPAERDVADAWRQVLGVESIGRDDDFFALGGDSLLATRAVARMRASTGLNVSIQDIYEAPRLAGLADRLERLRARPAREDAAPPPIRRTARRATQPPGTAGVTTATRQEAVTP